MTSNKKLYPIILSGGSGTRLWPLSRAHYPKQLISLIGERSMLQDTAARLDGLQDIANPLIICNEEHRFLVAEQFRQSGIVTNGIILEPVGRNTAPALTVTALRLLEDSNDAIMLVMPADHVIQNTAEFQSCANNARKLALSGKLVTFGIKPTAPETGYGYLKQGEGNSVDEFIEKPGLEKAKQYIAERNYLWNSGMFMMLASVWLEEIKRFRPDIYKCCQQAYQKGSHDQDFYRLEADSFFECPSDSIDYAVMEKTDRAVVTALDAGWSDVGAWSSLWQLLEQDHDGNVVKGDVYTHNTRDTLLLSEHRFIAAVGLKNIIVVETPDAVLVADRNSAQDVKVIVDKLKDKERSEYEMHRKVYRPWGSYEGVDVGPRFQVKRLIISPGAALSLQKHEKRAEHWVVVEGVAKVTRGDEIFELTEDQSTYIPIGVKHRLENPGDTPLEIIEVQSGSYFGEDDIVRFEDRYNRAERG